MMEKEMRRLIAGLVGLIMTNVFADGMLYENSCQIMQDNKYYISARVGPSILRLNKGEFHANPKRSWKGELEAGYIIDPAWHVGFNVGRTANFNYSSNHEAWDDSVDFSTNHSTSFKSEHLLLNGYYHFPNLDLFTPYIGLGGGIARNTINDVKINVPADNGHYPWKIIKGKTINRAAWNVMFGTLMQLNEDNTLKLDVQYRYADHGKASTNNYYTFAGCTTIEECPAHKTRLKFHALMLGLKYEF